MGRIVSAVVTWGDAYLGVIGPFPVSTPWWSEVEPVVAHLHQVLDVPVLVLRLLLVEGGEGGRDGHVTYHVAALNRPAPGLLAERPVDQAALTRPEDLRSPWARVEGIREMLSWASDMLGAAGRRVTGPAVQHKTWNLAALFRLPTGKGPVWLKTTPRFAADEASVIAAFARIDPTLVPPLIGAGPRRVLLEHLPGEDCWEGSPQIITSAVQRLVTTQAVLAGQPASIPPGLPDRRTPVIAGQIRALLDGPLASELTAAEATAARRLLSRFPLLDECGLPDTIVHGDFHPGNWRSDGGPPVIVDFADARRPFPGGPTTRSPVDNRARSRSASGHWPCNLAWRAHLSGCSDDVCVLTWGLASRGHVEEGETVVTEDAGFVHIAFMHLPAAAAANYAEFARLTLGPPAYAVAHRSPRSARWQDPLGLPQEGRYRLSPWDFPIGTWRAGTLAIELAAARVEALGLVHYGTGWTTCSDC